MQINCRESQFAVLSDDALKKNQFTLYYGLGLESLANFVLSWPNKVDRQIFSIMTHCLVRYEL